MNRFSDPEIPIDCPECRKKIKKRLSQLGHNRVIRCSCGQEIRTQGNGATDFKKSLTKLEQAIKRFGR